MGLSTSTTDRFLSEAELSYVGRAASSVHRRAAAYRCPICGDEEVFDSLAACCRCCEECYGASAASVAVQRPAADD